MYQIIESWNGEEDFIFPIANVTTKEQCVAIIIDYIVKMVWNTPAIESMNIIAALYELLDTDQICLHSTWGNGAIRIVEVKLIENKVLYN